MSFFTVDELVRSKKAVEANIVNTTDKESLSNLLFTISQLDKVRELLKHPMYISSGYRCDALNNLVGGAKDSYHLRGLAVDFVCPAFGSSTQVVDAIINSGIEYDMLILEYPNKPNSWVHIQFSKTPRRLNKITIDGSYKDYKPK